MRGMATVRLLLAAALALAATLRPAAAADNTLHVVAAFPGGIEVIENVARYAGLYKAEGVDVDKQYSGAASICVQLAASGKADVCATGVESTILGYSKGIRLKMFLARVHAYEFILGVPADSPIKTLADFKGTDIGEPNPAAITEVSADHMLEGAGLKKSDYNYIPVGVSGQALAAVASHKVVGLSTDRVALAIDAAVAHQKFRIFSDPLIDSIPDSGFEASPQVLASKGDLIKRYARALIKAAILIRENPQVAARYALMGENVGPVTPDAIHQEAVQLIALQSDLVGVDPMDPRLGAISLSSFALYDRLLFSTGWTPTYVPPSEIITNEFIPYANDFDKKAWIAAVKRMR
jgi:NitT/TauT family transport system substrate-binding protein